MKMRLKPRSHTLPIECLLSTCVHPNSKTIVKASAYPPTNTITFIRIA